LPLPFQQAHSSKGGWRGLSCLGSDWLEGCSSRELLLIFLIKEKFSPGKSHQSLFHSLNQFRPSDEFMVRSLMCYDEWNSSNKEPGCNNQDNTCKHEWCKGKCFIYPDASEIKHFALLQSLQFLDLFFTEAFWAVSDY